MLTAVPLYFTFLQIIYKKEDDCLFCTHSIVNIMEFDVTDIQLRG